MFLREHSKASHLFELNVHCSLHPFWKFVLASFTPRLKYRMSNVHYTGLLPVRAFLWEQFSFQRISVNLRKIYVYSEGQRLNHSLRGLLALSYVTRNCL